MPIRPENRARYPADWALRSRFVREVRSRGRCEWCGVANGAAILPLRCCEAPELTGAENCGHCGTRVPRIVLTCAHVFDDRPEAADLLNLAALCQRCHNRHDAEPRRRRRRERLDRLNGVRHLFPFNE